MSAPPLSVLSAADARAAEHCRARASVDIGLPSVRLTLDPERPEATPLTALYRTLAPRLTDDSVAEALALGLAATTDAIIAHFPDNLLWDLDTIAAALIARCDEAIEITRAFDDIVKLIALYGRHTAIRFRYIHDFTYGFDWAKWVRRGPIERAGIGPFDEAHLSAILHRGHELLALIEADDPRYARLRDARARNPFGFSREPADEIRLHRALARDQLVPVRAWELDSTPTWDRAFADLRAAHAAGA